MPTCFAFRGVGAHPLASMLAQQVSSTTRLGQLGQRADGAAGAQRSVLSPCSHSTEPVDLASNHNGLPARRGAQVE